jgi:hypothetical protein
MPTLRIPLNTSITARNASINTDSIIANGLLEKVNETLYARKRPGTLLKVTVANTAQGIYYYMGTTFEWDAGNTATTPSKNTIV